nr:rhodanese-like domain-containing protein [uncultured Mucilaginibacter sp.]
MKNKILLVAIFFFTSAMYSVSHAQTSPKTLPLPLDNYPWKENELMKPSVLAAKIAAHKSDLPIILNIGAVEDIQSAVHIGAASKTANLTKLKNNVSAQAKSKLIVIYCGCCPFPKCPNIRPAFLELKKLGFTNIKLLNLPVNLKTDWISKGYPLAGS